jgi:bifunctional DNA-binding transcriptional regulator/antitoxin component of YhaV-PrlF toxin-antitoxin module|tara:strand:+ start:323 stop:499 length:177 start_codon:yes stop_codon:yes gene_type:complete
MSELKQVSSVKTIDQYKRIYIPDAILERMQLEAGDNVVWMYDEIAGEHVIRKATVTIE